MTLDHDTLGAIIGAAFAIGILAGALPVLVAKEREKVELRDMVHEADDSAAAWFEVAKGYERASGLYRRRALDAEDHIVMLTAEIARLESEAAA